MELSVLNIEGKETGRKVSLDDQIFGIEPSDHAIYLDVKQYLANQRQGTSKSKGHISRKNVQKLQEAPKKSKGKKVLVQPAQVVLNLLFLGVGVPFLARVRATMVLN